jgi:Cu/Zn superoxide dismutase
VGITTAATVAALAGALPATAAPKATTKDATFASVNAPNASGTATIAQTGKNTTVSLSATGLGAGMHMHHIRGVRGGHATCPIAALDTNGDGRVDLREGLPAYGPVA